MELEFLTEFLSFPQLQFLPLTNSSKTFLIVPIRSKQLQQIPSLIQSEKNLHHLIPIWSKPYSQTQTQHLIPIKANWNFANPNPTNTPPLHTDYNSQTQNQQSRHHLILIWTCKPKPTNAIHPNRRWVSVENERYGTKHSERTTSVMSFSLGGPIWTLI